MHEVVESTNFSSYTQWLYKRRKKERRCVYVFGKEKEKELAEAEEELGVREEGSLRVVVVVVVEDEVVD